MPCLLALVTLLPLRDSAFAGEDDLDENSSVDSLAALTMPPEEEHNVWGHQQAQQGGSSAAAGAAPTNSRRPMARAKSASAAGAATPPVVVLELFPDDVALGDWDRDKNPRWAWGQQQEEHGHVHDAAPEVDNKVGVQAGARGAAARPGADAAPKRVQPQQHASVTTAAKGTSRVSEAGARYQKMTAAAAAKMRPSDHDQAVEHPTTGYASRGTSGAGAHTGMQAPVAHQRPASGPGGTSRLLKGETGLPRPATATAIGTVQAHGAERVSRLQRTTSSSGGGAAGKTPGSSHGGSGSNTSTTASAIPKMPSSSGVAKPTAAGRVAAQAAAQMNGPVSGGSRVLEVPVLKGGRSDSPMGSGQRPPQQKPIQQALIKPAICVRDSTDELLQVASGEEQPRIVEGHVGHCRIY